MGNAARRRIGAAPAAAARRPRERRTALVLSGGTSPGALQVGMLRALYEHRIQPALLVGTSAGAINEAFIAARPQTPATAIQLGRILHGLHREDVFPASMSALIGESGSGIASSTTAAWS